MQDLGMEEGIEREKCTSERQKTKRLGEWKGEEER